MAGRQFWHESHLELPADLAPVIRVMLEPGRRSARRDGWLAGNGRLVAWLDQFDRLAAVQTPSAPAFKTAERLVEPCIQRWLTTKEAAELLGVSERRVRQMSTRLVGRHVNGRRVWLEADVLEEADARSEISDSTGRLPSTDNTADDVTSR
jgi:hypothetical protein